MADLLSEVKLLNKTCFDEVPSTENENEDKCTVSAEAALAGKVVGLFFSAAWCAPCQHFVPNLREIYTELSRRGEALEIVFLSFDKTEEEMMDYYQHKHGDWLALKFGHPLRDTLAEKYAISVIPKLIVVQPSGDVITSKGRKDVQDKGLVCLRAWQAGMVVKAEKHDAEATEGSQEETEGQQHLSPAVS